MEYFCICAVRELGFPFRSSLFKERGYQLKPGQQSLFGVQPLAVSKELNAYG